MNNKNFQWTGGLALLLCCGAAPAMERVSVSSTGTEADGQSLYSVISNNGRYVAFVAYASNLVPDGSSGGVFLRDRLLGTTERIDLSTVGMAPDGLPYGWVAISPDARFVAFDSSASDLVDGDTNGQVDVFLRDRQSGVTERISVASDGAEGNRWSNAPSISDDGRKVAFMSYSSNLVGDDNNGAGDIFIRDRLLGSTERINLAADGSEAQGESFNPSISGDGQVVAFTSLAANLVMGDTNGLLDVFVHDRQTGVMELASAGMDRGGSSSFVSGDGQHVVFRGHLAGAPGYPDQTGVFVYHRTGGWTERMDLAAAGGLPNGSCNWASISRDGRSIAFASFADNLVAGDTNGTFDVFVRKDGTTKRVSESQGGQEGNSWSDVGNISADGSAVTFLSDASNLVAGDTNGMMDVFAIQTEASDLLPTAVSGPALAVPDIAFSVSGTVYNAGPAAVGQFSVSIYLSTDPVISSDDMLLKTQSVAGLAAGASVSGTVPVTVPITGTFYLGLVVDDGDAIAESDETNNTLAASSTIQVEVRAPDLLPVYHSGPDLARAGDTITVNGQVFNGDVIPAGPFSVGIYLSSDPTITTSDLRLGGRELAGLAAWGMVTGAVSVTIPVTVVPGPYHLGIIVDENEAIAESNESNNAKAYAIEIGN